MSNSPFVGPRPFEKEDSDRFFGRTRETEELLSLIIAHRAVLVYAQSGAGKTSLLKAGVLKRLEDQHYPILPPARVHGLLPNDLAPDSVQNIFVFHALQYWASRLPGGQSIKDHAKTTLTEFLRPLLPAPEAGEEGAPPLLVILDQFEEFFTTNPDRWQERRPFFDQLAQALQDLPTMKVVFVMREEYIAQLEPFAELLPEKLRPRMHLERLRGNAARSAVVQPFRSWGLSFDPVAADKLMAELSEIRVAEGDKFREVRGEFVEPVQLQVVCQSLWENLPAEWKNGADASKDSPHLITSEYIERFGDVNTALARYYDRSVERAAAASQGRIGEGELRRWFGTALITPTGTRGLAFRGAPGATWRIPGLALKELEDAHVIRREERAGAITHELTHDRFIEPVQKSNKAWLADYDAAEKVRAKLEERAAQNPDEILDELALRQAEEYLASPVAKILGATQEAQALVKRSRREVEDAKRRQVEELEEARQRAIEEERLHKAESERADAERARAEAITRARGRERIYAVSIAAVLILGLWVSTSYWWRLHVEKTLRNERGKDFRNRAVSDLKVTNDPTRRVTALRNLALALNTNRQDTEAAKMARDLLLERVWCPPAAPEVRYRQDTLLAATFTPGGSNSEIFTAAGDGQLLFWNGRELSSVRSLFQKPEPGPQQIVQPGIGSFSPDGLWLFIIPPTLASAANAEPAEPGAPQQGAGGGSTAGVRREPSKLQIWRWSVQKRTYEPAGEDLEIQRLRGSRIFSVTWSNESDRVVLINSRLNENECAFFEVEGNTFREVVDRSNELNAMKIVALAFAKYRSGIAAVSMDPAAPALRKVSFIGADDLKVISGAMHGQDSIRLSEGFQPVGVAFGPGSDQLTLTSWSGVRILDLRDGKVTPVPMPTFRDQFMRIVVGPRDPRLVATSLYGRVEVTDGTQMQEPAEPVVFRGSIGIAQFSPDGQRLLILSGGVWNVFDSMRLIDVSPLYRKRKATSEKFEAKPPPQWLADIASAVSALDRSGDGALLTLKTVQERYPESKAGDPYEAVWKRFFPNERNGH